MTTFSLLLLWAGLKYIESCAQFLGIEQDDFFDEDDEEEAGGRAVPEIVVPLPAVAAAGPAMVGRPMPDGAGGMVVPATAAAAAQAGRGGIRIV